MQQVFKSYIFRKDNLEVKVDCIKKTIKDYYGNPRTNYYWTEIWSDDQPRIIEDIVLFQQQAVIDFVCNKFSSFNKIDIVL